MTNRHYDVIIYLSIGKELVMKVISNIIWFIFGGLWLFLMWAFLGVMLCITLIGIPFGIQCFKLARISAFPYGKKIALDFGKHPFLNVLWVIFVGWEAAIMHVIIGILSCLTIIGIPRGIQCFKLTRLILFPFGAKIK